MTPRIVRYKRRPETCTVCHEPIARDPTTDGLTYGWRPTDGRCYVCHLVDLFGVNLAPTEVWWRKVRRLLRAAAAITVLNESTIPDVGDL